MRHPSGIPLSSPLKRQFSTSSLRQRVLRPPPSYLLNNTSPSSGSHPDSTTEAKKGGGFLKIDSTRSATAWLHGLVPVSGKKEGGRQDKMKRGEQSSGMFSGNRRNHTATAFAEPVQDEGLSQAYMQGNYGPSASDADDTLLREIFDAPTSPSAFQNTSRPTGLFLHPRLTSPAYFRTLTAQTLLHAQHLVDRILSIHPNFTPSFPSSPFTVLRHSDDPEAYMKALRFTPKLLDRLSDVLCLAMDMAELVRNVHPSEDWVRESEGVYEVLGRYMNGLNTHVGLYEALKLCRETPHNPPLTSAEHQLIQTFINDFEKSGIHLPEDTREKFVNLSDEIQILGRKFLGDVAAGQSEDLEENDYSSLIEIPDADDILFGGLESRFIMGLPRGGDHWSIKHKPRTSRFVAPYSWEAQMILRYAANPTARKIVYEGSNAHQPERVHVLEELLKKRGELAGVLGQESWADVQLSDKMAKSPKNVMEFLTSLANDHRPKAMEEVAELAKMKRVDIGNTSKGWGAGQAATIMAWDRDYYSERLVTSRGAGAARTQPIGEFFSAGTVIQGLSRLFDRLYGLRFVPVEMRRGESWSEDVRKVHVVNDIEGTVGIIYFDLFNRPNKSPNAAHYTVRCSRRIDDDDPNGDRMPPSWDWGAGMTGVEDFEGVKVRGKKGRYQLPVVVLSTDFARPSRQGPSFLAWPEVETLFHEMGHAIHSMLGRTEYHNVSGTRCATDFVELPSILMESFVSSTSVLPLFARHYKTDRPLPASQFETHLHLSGSLNALETNSQIMMAILDQVYHSPEARARAGIDTTEIYQKLQSELGVIPPVPGTAWQTQFGHLYGYGATYYSYLFDRAIAKKVWAGVFADEPLSREGGERFKEEVLRWGGGKDPWEMIGELLKDEELAKGDRRAMEKVGKWM